MNSSNILKFLAFSIISLNILFAQPTYTVSGDTDEGSVTVNYTGGVTSSNPSGNYSFSVDSGWTGTITPSKTGFTFSPPNISITDLSGDTSNVDFTAILNTYTISTSSTPSAGGSTSGGGTFSHGASVSVTATPNTGYTFVNWTEGGIEVSANSTYNFTAEGNRTLTANFTVSTYNISTSSDPSAGGTTSGGGTYSHGASVSVTATPNTGYTFVNWTEGGVQVSANSTYNFTAEENRTLVANFSLNTYSISTSSSPASGGSTSGGGNYSHGSSVSLTATPNTGYTFVNWTEGGVQVSANSTYNFTAEENRTLVANFSLNTYSISTSSSPAAGGSTSGGGNYSHGASVSVTATPNTGYTFVNWTEGGVQVSANPTYNFTASSNRTLVANFSLNTYSISTSSNPTAGGSTTGGGNYAHGASVSVTATPNTGYTFVNWTEGGVQVSANPTYNFTASSNRTLVANFSLNTYTISTSSSPAAGGSTSGGGNYAHGASVSVTATPNTGYTFVNWTEGGVQVSANSTYNFTASGNRTLVANFTVSTYTISTSSNPAAGGTTSGGGNYSHGASVSLTATPNTGYTFVNWTEGGVQVSANPTYNFTASSNRTLVANFSLNTYTISTSSSPTAGGTTSGGGNYSHGASVSVTATPNTGYTFVNWTEGGVQVSANPTYNFTASGNRTLVANFSLNTYTISTSSNPTAGGTTSGGGNYAHGASVSVTATPNTGYTFVNWTEGGVQVSANPIYNFTASSNRTLVANFSLNTYTISTSSSPAAGGSTSGGGNYSHGASVSLNAAPNTGYTFINWTESGVEVSSDSNYNFTATGNRTLTANFSKKVYTISAIANPAAGGITTGGGNYPHGESVTVIATPNTGYTFLNWTENGEEVSADSIYTFNALKSRTLVANFSLNTYTISTSSKPPEGGNTSGAGTYNHGQLVNLNASNSVGYNFVNWTEGEIVVSTLPNYSFTAMSNRNLTANFQLNNYTISANVNPSAGGVTSGAGNYIHGSQVTMVATPATGYDFLNWSELGTVVSTDSIYSFTAQSNRSLTANFVLKKYILTLNSDPSTGGTTSGQGTYNHGSMVRVTALSNIGWKFQNWTENGIIISNDSTFSFVIFGNRQLTANFVKKIYNIAASALPSEAGSTSGSGTYEYGVNATVRALSNIGWKFNNWREDGNTVSSDSVYTFRVTRSRNLVAAFEKKKYQIKTTASPAEGGIVYGDSIYTHGDEVTVGALPNDESGWEFVNWTENDISVSNSLEYKFTATRGRNLVANFRLKTYTVNIRLNPADAGSSSGSGTYTHGDSVSVIANPGPGWLFANWTENDVNVSNDSIYTFRIESNRSLVANFANVLYSIIGKPEPAEAGIISGSGSFYFGQKAIIIATPNYGWNFDNWEEEGTEVSKNPVYEFTVSNDRNLVANFSLSTFLVTCTANPTEGGVTSGCGIYFYNQEITVSAVSNNGWEFMNWSEGDDIVSEEKDFTFRVERNRDLRANFELTSDIEQLADARGIPDNYYLSNPYPNPFNPTAKIEFGLPEPSVVEISIFNINGELVETVLDKVSLPAGNYLSKFNANSISSGMYFYRVFVKSLETDKHFRKVAKLLLVK